MTGNQHVKVIYRLEQSVPCLGDSWEALNQEINLHIRSQDINRTGKVREIVILRQIGYESKLIRCQIKVDFKTSSKYLIKKKLHRKNRCIKQWLVEKKGRSNQTALTKIYK